MKKIFLFPIAVLLFVISISNCSKEVVSHNDEFDALDPLQPDTNAYKWLPVLLSAPDEFSITAPLSVTSADYAAELNEIRSLQVNLSGNDRNMVKYWSAGSVLRWNEILRELVAKHNLPPYQNDDGSYPTPNAANPFAYPEFPFSNPPYAARAYAYVSAAQYDALIAAAYYQNIYKRNTPNKVAADIQVLVPGSQLTGYSYPSSESAIAGAAVEMLKLLFPTEIGFIQQKAHEQKLSRMMAGASTRSDLEAGEALGKLVASKFVTRAKADNTGKAIGDAAYWASLEQLCINRGETPWISLETPKRPPMLPKFGAVKGFLIDSAMIAQNRPAPPPPTYSAEFQLQVDEVKSYVDNPTRERIAIVHYWADGAGTSTPPGHWNAIAAEDFVMARFSEFRWARNMALLNMTMMDAAICCWEAKYFYFTPRPSQMNSSIKTLTGIPNFPAYTSGHSSFSGGAATILSHLIPSEAAKYDSYATEASMSRLYGGIHYRMDCEAGLTSGRMIGNKAIERAKIDGAE